MVKSPARNRAGVILKKTNMKKHILYFTFLLLNCFPDYSQGIINNAGTKNNEAIQQIVTPGINDILSFQTLNRGMSNFALSRQTGNQNTVNINQQNNAGLEMSNQSYSVQSGNLNELSVGQVGSGNLLLGFQLGYLTTLSGSQQDNPVGVEKGNWLAFLAPNEANGYAIEGVGNKLTVSQSGNNNGVLAVQQGSDNILWAEQRGNNNYLMALQKGTNNTVSGYKQENQSEEILMETIIQIGENISLKTQDASLSKPTGNTFTQTGTNLSLEVNNGLLNTAGGVEITQTGHDMKVVMDQSLFSFPMK